jgi:hydrogenase maturation protein HypF
MAEHVLTGPVIGLSLDGTGYGTDGRIWGGEVLISRMEGFERFAHLDYVPMPGGEAAIREPWRMAFGHLHAAGFNMTDPALLSLLGATEKEARILERMIERGVNSPFTSSCGRLFDAIAAVVLNRREVDYEAQAAIELEGSAVDEPDCLEFPDHYAIELKAGDWSRREPTRLLPASLWRAILADLSAGIAKSTIAARFHAAIAAGFIEVAVHARAETGITHVALSGGCMHNRRLVTLLRRGLETRGFEVFQQTRVSPGDGGLSYGQAAIAATILYSETTH